MGETLVRMPKLADTLVEGTLGQWLKHVGDEVSQGEPLASIETDKVTTEMTSPGAGTLLEVLVAEGQTVPVETPIARIGTPGAVAAPLSVASPPASPPASSPPLADPLRAAGPHDDLKSVVGARSAHAAPARRPTPVAARLLAEHGLAADQIVAHAGRLTKQDVLRHLESSAKNEGALSLWERAGGEGGVSADSPPSPGSFLAGLINSQRERRIAPHAQSDGPPSHGDGVLVPLTSMRRAIADHMARAFGTIPHGQTVMAADFTRLVAWREQQKQTFLQSEGANLTFTVLFVHALANALALRTNGPVDLGVAVALDGGLIVPVLRAANTLSLGATAQGIADLAARARSNKLAPDETQGAQMTVTNVGSFGNLTASPIVPLNQMGILGPGLVEQRPLPGPDNGLRLGWRCLLSLMFDRRALDDFAADRLLRSVVDELDRIPKSV